MKLLHAVDGLWAARGLGAAFVIVVAASAEGQPRGPAPEEWAPAQDEIVVEQGDTLWSLTARVAGNPFLWPKVWSFNPEITNPHWIYPGDVVRFTEPKVDLPSRTELIAGQMDMPPEEPPPEEGPVEEIEGVEGEIGESRGPTIEVVENTMPARTTGSLQRFVGLFVTQKELQEAGVLTNARPDKVMLSPGDEIYFVNRAKAKPTVGDQFLIYRTLREVRHPESGSSWGYMTQLTGSARVVGHGKDDVVTARITGSYVEIERGQFLTPLVQDPLVKLTRTVAKRQVEGTIIAVRDDFSGMVGNDDLVFIDKGKSDGIERGNQFVIIDRGDQLTKDADQLPFDTIGMLQVVEAKETAATCLVLRAQREIEPGARVRTVAP